MPWNMVSVSTDLKSSMNRTKNTGFADRLSAAADTKKAQLERAARARSEAESPAAVERRKAREAVRLAAKRRVVAIAAPTLIEQVSDSLTL
jgi:Family of unknown function (DUF6481)